MCASTQSGNCWASVAPPDRGRGQRRRLQQLLAGLRHERRRGPAHVAHRRAPARPHPRLVGGGQRRADERRAYREAHPADSYLDRSAFGRCILGFNTRPPMTPGFYNQNMQLFQTPDHVVVLNDLVHD